MGKRIAMISALGGQGCTLSAAYVGTALAESGRSVTMLDMCGFGGTLTNALGAAEYAAMNVGDVLRGECGAEEAFVLCDMPGLRVLPPVSFADGYVSPYGDGFSELVRQISEENDVIADMPSGTLPDENAVKLYDLFVICSRAERFALERAAALRRILECRCSEAEASCEVRLLVTMLSEEDMRSDGLDIDECIDIVGARLLGVVPYDGSTVKCFKTGAFPDALCEAMRFSRDIVCRLLGERVPLDSRRRLFG